MPDAEFQPIRPFDIDDGQLGDLSQEVCFVLGYELCQIDSLIASGKQFQKPIHSVNQGRIEAELHRQKRTYRVEWMTDDVSESWVDLYVYGLDES